MPAARSGADAGGSVSVDLSAHTRRQVAIRLLPFLFVLYIVNYIDRTNVAYAALEMSRDLGFSDRVFGLGAGIFFVSYVALQIPGALLVELWSARRCVAAILVAWGALTALTALVHSAGQLYLARFVLGAAEAGFFPGVVVYLSHWFIREDRAKAGSRFMAAIPLSFVIGSPLAGWIVGHRWMGIAGWRWLFVLEGLPAILLGVTAFLYLTDWPGEASWLAPRQREWLVNKLQEEKPADPGSATAWEALRSPGIRLLAVATFLEYFFGYTAAFWFPTILKRVSGFSDARVGWLGAVPYMAAFFAMQLNGWHSDKMRERRWHAAAPVFAASIALLGLTTLPRTTGLTVALFTVVCMAYSFIPIVFAMPCEILSQSAAAAAVGLINAVGSVAGFAGPYAFGYLNTVTGSYRWGLAIMTLCAITSAMLLLRAPEAPAETASLIAGAAEMPALE
jgi:ACS family tartrate transporter-like MFS transporter